MGSLLPAGAVRATALADTQSPLWHPEPAERSCAAGEATQMAFSYRLTLLRTLLECLGKPDERCEERDQSGQKSHKINQIGHGHHLPSDGGRYPAHGTAANSINSIKAQLDMRMFVRISEDRNSGMAKEQFLCHARTCRRTATYIFRVIRPRCWFCINAPPGLSEVFVLI